MKNVSKTIVIFFIAIMLMSCEKKDNTVHKNEWVEDGKYTYYYAEDGQKLKNKYRKFGGVTYAFDKNGRMIKNKWNKEIDEYGVITGFAYYGSDGQKIRDG